MMRNRSLLLAIAAALLLLQSCGGAVQRGKSADKQLIVSILPLKYVATVIVGDDFTIDVLVPPGSSPETYEIAPSQAIELADARLVLTTGLMDFEQRLTSQLPENKIVDLSATLELIGGHSHAGRPHGADPHIWLSPRNLRTMAHTFHARIALLHPDSTKYGDNLRRFERQMDSLDMAMKKLANSSESNSFIIYHPALSYLARDYGLRQIALEHDGKEPSADHLRQIVAQSQGIANVLYQREFSKATVETLAREIGGRCVEIDPLAEDVGENICFLMELICSE